MIFRYEMKNISEDDIDADIISVSEFTERIKDILESESDLRQVWIKGEISNFTEHSSGHMYFSIKDETSQLQCVMFRIKAERLRFFPKHGDSIMLKGSITVYNRRGNYQLIVEEMHKQGLGDLHRRFLKLKEKLSQEGLFDPSAKKPIPQFPKTLGIVTSPTGAAIQDILDTIKRRFPCIRLVIAPAIVQGEQGAQSIVSSIRQLNSRKDIDTIIVARGGGSLEDLWNFNEEIVAREIFRSTIPIISGVGHETDFTIADFVADLRAPTPSIAAERATPKKDDWLYTLNIYSESMKRTLKSRMDFKKQYLDSLEFKISSRTRSLIDIHKKELKVLSEKLAAMNPKKVLKRGYSITMQGSRPLKTEEGLNHGDMIKTILYKGKIYSKVQKNKDQEEK
jgi:exodeoxyribonuclease VII large subunit